MRSRRPTDIGDGPFEVVAQRGAAQTSGALTVKESEPRASKSTPGSSSCRLPRRGANVIDSITRAGREALRDGKLVLLRQDRAASSADAQVRAGNFRKHDRESHLEQRGPARAVVKVEGKHSNGQHAPGCRSRCVSISTPAATRCACCTPSSSTAMRSQRFHPRHRTAFLRAAATTRSTIVTCASWASGDGVFARSRARPHRTAPRSRSSGAPGADRRASLSPAITPVANNLLQYIPAFGDWTLLQPNANSFTIRKRTADGHAWLDARAASAPAVSAMSADRPAASRSASAISGRAIRRSSTSATRSENQAQRHDVGVGARRAARWTCASITTVSARTRTRSRSRAASRSPTKTTSPASARRWASRAPASSCCGFCRATPTRDTPHGAGRRAARARRSSCRHRKPRSSPACSGTPFRCLRRRAPEHAQLEQRLDWMFDFYRGQQDQRGWYGFWNYGDVMHTYDFDRHEWRYDVGGFAWDNSELAHRPVALAVLPAHRSRRYVPLRRSDDAPHRRGRRASPRPLRAARLAAQRHALGLLGQTTAHQHGAEPPLLLLPHRRRTRRRSHARADRGRAHAAHRASHAQAAGRRVAPGG